MTVRVVLASLSILIAGCGSPGQNVVRSDAARRFSCAPSRIEVDDLGPRTARASGCGKSLLYSCQQSRGSAYAFPKQTPLTEGEAQGGPAEPGGACTWGPSD